MLYELPFANLGGTEKHVLTLIKALGREVTPCLMAPQGEALSLFRDEGVPYQIIDPLAFAPGVRRSLEGHRAAFHHLMEEFRFSLVHVHGGIEYAVAAKLARPDIPVVFTIHGYPDIASYVVSGFLANRIADEVICVSDWEYHEAAKYGFRRDRLTVIHNGIVPPQPTGARRAFRRE
ncbi:MAG: glycosyltransferase family 4 protein, partial [Bacillota bacterium]